MAQLYYLLTGSSDLVGGKANEKEYYKISSTNQKILAVMYMTLGILYVGLLLFVMHNAIRYIRKLPRKSWMIVAFYALSAGTSIFHIVYFFKLGIEPDRSPFYYQGDYNRSDKLVWMDIFEMIGSYLWYLLAWLVIAMVFQLSMAIKVILQ